MRSTSVSDIYNFMILLKGRKLFINYIVNKMIIKILCGKEKNDKI